MKQYSGLLFFALLAALYFGCRPAPVFPDEPILKFKKFIQPPGSDSLEVVFSFTDGDGDIGIAPNDTSYNMLLTAYHDSAGQWIYLRNPNDPSGLDSLKYKYRIPKLIAGQSGLEGDIYVTINKAIMISSGNDTLQFNAFLLDQSHHKSVVIRTPEVDLIP
jgi:hypothetical protein